MCGIAGAVSQKLTAKDEAFFSRLLFLSQWRGEDSTGVLQVRSPVGKIKKRAEEGESLPVRYLKGTEPSSWFLEHKEVKKLIGDNTDKAVLMGHTRAATVGDITVDNAHPYDFKGLIGVYNGTADKFKIPGHADFDTDGEAIYNFIETKGATEALGTLLGLNTPPPFALAWFDKNLNALRFARSGTDHNNRPLWFIRSKDGNTIYFGSDPMYIHFAARSVDLELSSEIHPMMPKRGFLYTVPLLDNEDLAKYTLEEIPLILPPKEVHVNRPFHGRAPLASSTALTTQRAPAVHEVITTSVSGLSVPWNQYTNKARERRLTTENPGPTQTFRLDDESDDVEEAKAKRIIAHWPIGVALTAEEIAANLMARKMSEQVLAKADNDNPQERDEYVGNNGHPITRAQFDRLLAEGCCNCAEVPSLLDDPYLDHKIAWGVTDVGTRWFCESCKKEEWLQTHMVTYDYEKDHGHGSNRH